MHQDGELEILPTLLVITVALICEMQVDTRHRAARTNFLQSLNVESVPCFLFGRLSAILLQRVIITCARSNAVTGQEAVCRTQTMSSRWDDFDVEAGTNLARAFDAMTCINQSATGAVSSRSRLPFSGLAQTLPCF